jgi:hypothetical protein
MLKPRKPWLAVVLSTLLAGAGHLYAGDAGQFSKSFLPPPVLKCSATSCDQTPKDLEQFTAEFFKWYVRTSTESYRLGPRKSGALDNHQQASLKKILTPDFYNKRITPSEDPGSDLILQAQDYDDEWGYMASATLMSLEKKSAKVTIRFPLLPIHYGGEKLPPYSLVANLKAIDGEWRIDSV